ncbi:MAG: efflux RND transporter periplasmic adaptor subunit [Bacteroidales bacterium]|nr:efflux RND transporter periplasmic adaptor subunit [Bacteroidales bacterium]
MKKILVIGGILVALIGLGVFNKLISKDSTVSTYAEAQKGVFEITVTNSGELLAENSIEVMGPELGQTSNQGQGGGGRGQVQAHGRGMDMRMMDFKIVDIVPEGTMVEKGDYIAQLDRTSYDNTLREEVENVKTLKANVEMRMLDTAVSLTNLRDEIKNMKYQVEEAGITLEQSKYEPPATIRQAEIALNKAQRALEQLYKSYELKVAQARRQITYQQLLLSRRERLVEDLQEFLAQFTIRAPSPGMVTYKKDRTGAKRKTGSSINAFDKVVATLPDLSSMISKIYVSEIEINKVSAGQPVEITIDAFPEKLFTGTVTSVANIGEQLPNSDAKMFEVMIKVNSFDPDLRPAMTTWNKIVIKTVADAVFIPLECVRTGTDGLPYVYKKNRTKQIVKLGDFNDKHIVIEQGIEAGTSIYTMIPENAESFRIVGANLFVSGSQGN